MKQIQGIWWPDDVADKWKHSLRHVKSLDGTLKRCTAYRTAVQAGGNIGLWPRRMAELFKRVYTFEPEPLSRECLERNVPQSVVFVSRAALGDRKGTCGISRKSLGSHKVQDGNTTPMITVDELNLPDLDLLQLDVEGYEWHALAGAEQTVKRCHPVVHLELRGFTEKYGKTDSLVREMLTDWGYAEVATAPGADVVFQWVH